MPQGLSWIHISEKERLYADVFGGNLTPIVHIEHWESKVKEGWVSGSGWNPQRGKLGAPEKQALYHSCYMWKKSLAGVRMCRGVAATATARCDWLGALSRLSSGRTVGGDTCAVARSM